MKRTLIAFGHAASHSPWNVQPPKALGVHLLGHRQHAAPALGLALRQLGQVADLRGR
jgi:hypothetical protein